MKNKQFHAHQLRYLGTKDQMSQVWGQPLFLKKGQMWRGKDGLTITITFGHIYIDYIHSNLTDPLQHNLYMAINSLVYQLEKTLTPEEYKLYQYYITLQTL